MWFFTTTSRSEFASRWLVGTSLFFFEILVLYGTFRLILGSFYFLAKLISSSSIWSKFTFLTSVLPDFEFLSFFCKYPWFAWNLSNWFLKNVISLSLAFNNYWNFWSSDFYFSFSSFKISISDLPSIWSLFSSFL